MTADQAKVKMLEERLAQISLDLGTLQESVELLEKQAEKQQEPLQEILLMFGSVKGGIQVLGWLGNIAKWVSVVTAGAAAAWVYWGKASGK